ncbi:C-terminal binding protein, partial [Trifolium medium]|nr:C-terminal binding protein [Trifolium medium]
VRRVGCGVDTFCWTDPWLGGVPLSVRFRPLFELSNYQTSSVTDMCALGGRRGDLAVASSVVGMGGRDVRGMHEFSSRYYFAA